MMNAQDREFDPLIEAWNKARGAGQNAEEGVRRLVASNIERFRPLLALSQKPSNWGELATSDGLPMSWIDFQHLVIKPHVERLEVLLSRIDAGLPYP
jgi:hypothetical protein